MRLYLNESGPNPGDYRQRQGFLWFPKWIGSEIRWLEYAFWTEEYMEDRARWISISWRNE